MSTLPRYKLIVEHGDTGEVIVSERTDSYLVAWQEPRTDRVQTKADVSPGFLARLATERFGGLTGIASKLTKLMAKQS